MREQACGFASALAVAENDRQQSHYSNFVAKFRFPQREVGMQVLNLGHASRGSLVVYCQTTGDCQYKKDFFLLNPECVSEVASPLIAKLIQILYCSMHTKSIL